MSFDLPTLEEPITRILSAPGVNLDTISAKRVRKALLADPQNASLGLTAEGLKERRDEVDLVIRKVFESVSTAAASSVPKRKREDGKDGLDDGDEQADASEGAVEAEEETVAKPQKKKGKKAVEESDAELARRLSTEINSRSRRGTSNVASSSTKKAKRRVKKSAETVGSADEDGGDDTKKTRRGGAKGGFAKEYVLSGPLSTLVGVEKLSRPQVVKKLWEYIREHELQNPSNKREIICDDPFRAVFAADKIDMFRMNKVLGQHLHDE